MEKNSACVMEWSIELEKALLSKKPGHSLEAISEIGPTLQRLSREPECSLTNSSPMLSFCVSQVLSNLETSTQGSSVFVLRTVKETNRKSTKRFCPKLRFMCRWNFWGELWLCLTVGMFNIWLWINGFASVGLLGTFCYRKQEHKIPGTFLYGVFSLSGGKSVFSCSRMLG